MPTPSHPTGNDVLRLAKKHIGERYVLGVVTPKDNPAWIGPWDCAEFASWLTYQISGKVYGCNDDSAPPSIADAYTGSWARDALRMGICISVDQAASTPGGFVLRAPEAGATGHIVVSDGKGGTVEAHSTRRGVIQCSLNKRRWDLGILVPGIAYAQNATLITVTPPDTTIYRLTTPPQTGPLIKKIQRSLKEAGFDPGGVDGMFGAQTQAAVVAYQLSKGLVPDGEVGPKTAKALKIELPDA